MKEIIKHYDNYEEDNRLEKDLQHQTEHILTNYCIDKYLKDGMKVLEIGAGTGVYSLNLAGRGFKVESLELVPSNIKIFKFKIKPNMDINVVLGNAINLSMYEDNAFDFVLCLGPLYHLEGQDRESCIKEAIRVCKKGGYIYFAYISDCLTFVQAISRYDKYLLNYKHEYDENFKLKDGNNVFTYLMPEEMENIMQKYDVKKLNHVSLDGVTRLIKDKVNNFNSEEFTIWIDYLKKTSEIKSILGYSEHIMYICQK